MKYKLAVLAMAPMRKAGRARMTQPSAAAYDIS